MEEWRILVEANPLFSWSQGDACWAAGWLQHSVTSLGARNRLRKVCMVSIILERWDIPMSVRHILLLFRVTFSGSQDLRYHSRVRRWGRDFWRSRWPQIINTASKHGGSGSCSIELWLTCRYHDMPSRDHIYIYIYIQHFVLVKTWLPTRRCKKNGQEGDDSFLDCSGRTPTIHCEPWKMDGHDHFENKTIVLKRKPFGNP